MSKNINFLAADLGASSGRLLSAGWDGERFDLQEIHRFANSHVQTLDRMQWDILRLWDEIKIGLGKYGVSTNTPPTSFGIDTWGVDYGLLDSAGQLLGNPTHYRDNRNNGIMEKAFNMASRDAIFQTTGLQYLQFNTLFQLYSMRLDQDPQLDFADTLLMMPDIFNYWLTGEKAVEYTIASTTQFMDARQRIWATDLLDQLSLPSHILPEIIKPGTILGPMLPSVIHEVDFSGNVPVIAVGSHDTASAVAGVPGLDAQSAYLSCGTWSLMGTEISEPIINEQVAAVNMTNEGGIGQTIRLLKNIGGLWLLQECQRQWQRAGHNYSWQVLIQQAKESPPFRSLVEPDSTDFLNPDNMLDAIREYCTCTAQPAPENIGQFVRCCLESLALRYRWVVEALERLMANQAQQADCQLEVIRIVGGGSQNELLCQFTADACQRLVVAGPVEATALGNVMVQAMATGHIANVTQGREAIAASVAQQTYEPGPVAGWDQAFERFKALGE